MTVKMRNVTKIYKYIVIFPFNVFQSLYLFPSV